jgi:hypothetical protein
MKNKTNKHRTHTLRRQRHQSRTIRQQRRTCKKGGMFRMAGKVVGEVIGKKGPDRVDKAWQVAQKVKEGLTPKSITKFNYAESPRSFASVLSPFRDEMHRHSFHDRAYNDAIHKTPTRPITNDEPPKLGRVRHRETDEERRRRLGLSVAPTSNHPDNIVKTLF